MHLQGTESGVTKIMKEVETPNSIEYAHWAQVQIFNFNLDNFRFDM